MFRGLDAAFNEPRGSVAGKKVGTDIFSQNDEVYLIIIDYYSNFKAVDQRPDTKASTVILNLKGHFTKNEITDQAVSGIGPQFILKE